MWESVPEGLPAQGWGELDENGWGALIGWAAGPENLRRGPRQDDSARTVAVARTGTDGSVVESVEAFTAEDRRIVEEEANAYLTDAGVEQRPPGFRWFVRLPAQFFSWDEFSAAVTRSVYAQEPQPVHPSEIAPVMKRSIQRLYAGQQDGDSRPR
ncbi:MULTISPECIES: DUF5956 family protein [unclassified Arthrobacter]|jgi:hypothetical protein|uniref:DUF5956 family protein n=1 Tax=unclassified Arthrobacter TaxID=235627 RepID=UPI001F2BBE90|nr:DUF5956 family protein [Arthrobacter sp. FW305-BF8]UKA52655.1 hypothetical protein LFT45_12860 [Arthrobacter sp. FW305-BF8]